MKDKLNTKCIVYVKVVFGEFPKYKEYEGQTFQDDFAIIKNTDNTIRPYQIIHRPTGLLVVGTKHKKDLIPAYERIKEEIKEALKNRTVIKATDELTHYLERLNNEKKSFN